MSIGSRLKKQALFDAVVGVVIVLAALAFVWISGLRLPGWDIKDDDIRMENEEKVESRDVFIRKGGSLEMEDSVLTLQSSDVDERGVYMEGSARLALSSSSIDGEDGYYILSLVEQANAYPTARLVDSQLNNSSGVYLYGRSKLTAENSTVGSIYVRENAELTLKQSSAALSITSGNDDVHSGLAPSDSTTKELSSSLGWNISLEECDIESYQLELFEDDTVAVENSKNIRLLFHTPGTLEEEFLLNAQSFNGVASGQLDTSWFSLRWTDTTFSYLSVIASGTDEVKIQDGSVDYVKASDSARIIVDGGSVSCSLCKVSNSSTVRLENVTVVAGDSSLIVVTGLGHLEIQDSDIRGMRVVVTGGGSLSLENTQFEEYDVEFEGEGDFVVDGELQEVET